MSDRENEAIDRVTCELFAVLKEHKVPVELLKSQVSWGPRWRINIKGSSAVGVVVKGEHRNFRTSSPWNGKVRISVTWHNFKKHFPQRKSGFDYHEIAEVTAKAIDDYKKYLEHVQSDNAKRKVCQEVLEKIKNDFADVLERVAAGPILWLTMGRTDNYEVKISGMKEQDLIKLLEYWRSAYHLDNSMTSQPTIEEY